MTHPFAVSTAEAEWLAQGRKFFTKRIYAQAALCFGKAQQLWWRDVALAYEDRRVAEQYAETHPSRRQAFKDVALAFLRQAGAAPSPADAQILFANAGKCYAEAELYASAAEAFTKAESYTDAVWNYRRAGLFDLAIDLIQQHTHQIEAGILEKVTYTAKVVYTKDGHNE